MYAYEFYQGNSGRRKCSKEEDKSLIAAGIKKAHSKINDEDSSEKEDISFADQVA